MPKETEWRSGGILTRVVTWQEAGESNSAWEQRHQDAVDAAKLIWPED